MNIPKILRLSLAALSLGVAASANAFILNASGLCNSAGQITTTSNEFSSLPEFGTTFGYSVGFGLGNPSTFTASFTNGGASLNLIGTGTSSSVNNAYSFMGSWTVSSQANTSVLSTATGTYSATFDINAGYFTYGVAGANPVPEPTSFAALGLGLVAVARRRRRA